MIKGLIVPSLAEGGKIKVGRLGPTRRSGNREWRLPMKLDHFIVTTTRRDDSGDLIVDEALLRELPKDADGKCRQIPIVLHDDDIERVFPTTLALYQGKKLFCRGDGETATRYEMKQGKRTGLSKEIPCPCEFFHNPDEKGPQCKPHGTLHCSIRVPGRAVAGAVYKLRTTSVMSIQRTLASLQQIRDILGTLCGIPLILKLESVVVAPKDGPSSTVYVFHVELREADILQVQRQAIESGKMRARVRASIGYQALVTAPGDGEDEIDEAEVAQEFHPEPDPGAPDQEVQNATERRQSQLRDDLARETGSPPADGANAERTDDEKETGEVINPEQVTKINGLIDQIEAFHEGAGIMIVADIAGEVEFDDMTKLQGEQAVAALEAKLKELQSKKPAAAEKPAATTDKHKPGQAELEI